MQDAPPKVFVSHASADKGRFVIGFAERLRAAGVDAWLDYWEMNPGDSLVAKIFEEGLSQCEAVIVVLSDYSIDSKWVSAEIDAAFVAAVERESRLIPVRLDGCEVPQLLRTRLWQEIPDITSYDDELSRIVNAIFGRYDKPPIGQATRDTSTDAITLEGLARIDSIVLEAVCRLEIEKGVPLIDPDDLLSKVLEIDVSEGEVIEAQDILEEEGCVRVARACGPPRVFAMRATPLGFDLFARTLIPNYSELCGDVAMALVGDGVLDNQTMAANLKVKQRIVDHILDSLEINDYVKLTKMSSGYIYVSSVSAKLRRKLAETD